MLNKRQSCCCEQAFLHYITRNTALFFNWLTFITLTNTWSSLSSTLHTYKPERVARKLEKKAKETAFCRYSTKYVFLEIVQNSQGTPVPQPFSMPQPVILLKKTLQSRCFPLHMFKFSRSFRAQRFLLTFNNQNLWKEGHDAWWTCVMISYL